MAEEFDAGERGRRRSDEGRVSVLVVDDEPDVLDLVDDYLGSMRDFEFDVETTTSPEAAVDRVAAGTVDCVVSDYEMPVMDGFDLLHRVRAIEPNLPFLLFTGRGSEEIASRAITEGVTDYLQKDFAPEQFELLANRIENAVSGYWSEEDRRQRETLLADVTENISESVFVAGDDYRLLYVNDAIEDLYGIPKATIEEDPMAFLEHVHPDDRGAVDEWIARLADHEGGGDAGREYEVDFRFDHPENGWRWITASVKPILDDSGEVDRVVGVASDVTERRTAVEELRRNEAKFRGIAETSNDVIFRTDDAGTVTYASPAIRDVLGYAPDDVEGEEFVGYIAEGHVETAFEQFAEAMAGEAQSDIGLALVHADGHAVPIEVSASPIRREGEVVGVQGLARDVSDRRARARELEQYETVVNTVPDGVFVLDEDGRVVSANDWAIRMVGIEDGRGDLPTEPLAEIGEGWIRGEEAIERYTEAVAELLSDEGDRTMYRLSVTHDGEPRAFEVHLALRPLDDGEYRGTIGVIRDITERQRYERELERQNDRLERFASVLSHDLRNPLNVAQARVQMAMKSGETGPLASADEALDRINELVDDVLTLAREGESPIEGRVSLAATARQAWDTVETEDAELIVEDPPGDVLAGESGVRRLLENLFRNAIEHGGADVSVTVGPLADGPGFFVADDGPGIPPAERGTVFEQGYSTAGSTGFGLAIVREVAEAHGWEVALTGGPDGGARFEFRSGVPAAASERPG